MVTDPWESLKAFTTARIAIGRAGSSIPLKQSLQFKLAHAHARDAVYSVLGCDALMNDLQAMGLASIRLHSKAATRQQYLQRPDLGRQPDERSLDIIQQHAAPCDINIIIGDGLSANAVNLNAIPLISTLVPLLRSVNYKLSPVCLAEQARVALADHIGHGLQAKLSVMLIGERPGLSSADSMGAYLIYHPKPGLTDESRNCISNIRQQGLSIDVAAQKIFYLIQESIRRKLSGVHLKDNEGLIEG